MAPFDRVHAKVHPCYLEVVAKANNCSAMKAFRLLHAHRTSKVAKGISPNLFDLQYMYRMYTDTELSWIQAVDFFEKDINGAMTSEFRVTDDEVQNFIPPESLPNWGDLKADLLEILLYYHRVEEMPLYIGFEDEEGEQETPVFQMIEEGKKVRINNENKPQ